MNKIATAQTWPPDHSSSECPFIEGDLDGALIDFVSVCLFKHSGDDPLIYYRAAQAAAAGQVDVLQLHRLVLPDDDRGFRETSGVIGIPSPLATLDAVAFDTCPPSPHFDEHLAAIQQMIRDFVAYPKGKEIESQAWTIHADLLGLHPFDDGNGRTARLLWNALRVMAGLPWKNIHYDEGATYDVSVVTRTRVRFACCLKPVSNKENRRRGGMN